MHTLPTAHHDFPLLSTKLVCIITMAALAPAAAAGQGSAETRLTVDACIGIVELRSSFFHWNRHLRHRSWIGRFSEEGSSRSWTRAYNSLRDSIGTQLWRKSQYASGINQLNPRGAGSRRPDGTTNHALGVGLTVMRIHGCLRSGIWPMFRYFV